MRPFEARWFIASVIGLVAALGFGVMTLKDPTIGGLILAIFAAGWGYGLRDAKQCDITREQELETTMPQMPQVHGPAMPRSTTAFSREVGR